MTTEPFARAAEHYDLLYRGKDYPAEAEFALAALRRLMPGVKSILELGCGTGLHALELARRGCRVTGIDRSGPMLARARRLASSRPAAERPLFRKADLRRVRLGRRFDAAVSFFHVFSYLTSPADLTQALCRARDHLRPGGVLLFDCWYGPAVLARPPKPRTKRAAQGGRSVERLSSMRWERARNVVEIRHRFRARRTADEAAVEFGETHRLRYWFREEVEETLRACGFSPAGAAEWMTERPLGPSTWSACFTAVASRRAKPRTSSGPACRETPFRA
ncbi:MAG: class I SAM-dependent DNA methyltransferase [Elusimicrobiota bacterium]